MANPIPHIRRLDGFNQGWIKFEGSEASVKGDVTLETVLNGLVKSSA
jgi:NAD(P)H dehydrogenase (quinone)